MKRPSPSPPRPRQAGRRLSREAHSRGPRSRRTDGPARPLIGRNGNVWAALRRPRNALVPVRLPAASVTPWSHSAFNDPLRIIRSTHDDDAFWINIVRVFIFNKFTDERACAINNALIEFFARY